MHDRFNNSITTLSNSASNHYIDGVDRILAGQSGITNAFKNAIEADPGFALAYAGLARGQQYEGNIKAAQDTMNQAKATFKRP